MKDSIAGTIKIIHQHAEEAPPGGAKSIVESGVLDDLDDIYGIHIFPTHPAGFVGYHSGYSMAGRSFFKLIIQGTGGHGSSPHLANDAIVAAAHFVTAVQTVISRRLILLRWVLLQSAHSMEKERSMSLKIVLSLKAMFAI